MLSIIIVNYNNSTDIKQCLKSFINFEPEYKKYEYIIVDNNSGDKGLSSLEKDYPFIKLIYAPKNGGFAYGNNFGIRAAIGDYILLLNPDTYIRDNSIEKLYDRIKLDSMIEFIGPQLLYPDDRNQSYYLPKTYMTPWRLFCERFFLHRIFKKSKLFNSYFRTFMDYDQETYVEQISGAAFMFKREVIEKLGYFDDKYFMYFEESDYCFNAIKKGYKLLYYPGSKIIHVGGLRSEGNWERSTKYYITSFKYYFKKNFTLFSYYNALLIQAVGSLLRVAIFYIKRDKLYKYHYLSFKNLLS